MIPHSTYYRIIKTGEIVILFLKETGVVHAFPAPPFTDTHISLPLPDKLTTYSDDEVEFLYEGNVAINNDCSIMIYYDNNGAFTLVRNPDFKNITDVANSPKRYLNHEN